MSLSGLILPELDQWLLAEGRHQHPEQWFGAHPSVHPDGQAMVRFLLYAPHATAISVVGDFNQWQVNANAMQALGGGLWVAQIASAQIGDHYQYAINDANGLALPWRADPYARAMQTHAGSASQIVTPLAASHWKRPVHHASDPLSIYEVHLPSWRRHPDGRSYSWHELADCLPQYVHDLGFTHLQMMPLSAHPFAGSWGYQPIGLFAPLPDLGDAAGLQHLIATCHQHGLGVLLDWVPAHFPTDPHGLAEFDGQPLYENADPLIAQLIGWNTLRYDYGRPQVQQFLIANARYWLEQFGFDGLRIDAVSAMLYRDYGRAHLAWSANQQGGREYLEAIDFLQKLCQQLHQHVDHCLLIAEESTRWQGVSKPMGHTGAARWHLGFDYKWNMGWMNDTLRYMSRPPHERLEHAQDIVFGMYYDHSEHFILPLSHDEVVHGKGTLLTRMAGERSVQFDQLRAYLAFMWAHCGKKLVFMGTEIAQDREWHHDRQLDWHMLEHAEHQQMQDFVRQLNQHYRQHPALFERDGHKDGFVWSEYELSNQGIVAFIRKAAHGKAGMILSVSNLLDQPQSQVVLGVPHAGHWTLLLDSHAQPHTSPPSLLAQAQRTATHPFQIRVDLPAACTRWFILTPQ